MPLSSITLPPSYKSGRNSVIVNTRSQREVAPYTTMHKTLFEAMPLREQLVEKKIFIFEVKSNMLIIKIGDGTLSPNKNL